MSTTSTETEKDPNDLTRPRVVIGLTFFGLVVLAGLILSTIFILEDRRDLPGADTIACERPASTDTGYSGTLPVDNWQRINAAYVPVTHFGPARISEATPTCYEHSPAGAVTAAVYIATLGSTGQTMTVLDHMSLDNANTDRFKDMVGSDEAVPANPPHPVALRLNDYQGDAARASVVLELNGRYSVVDIDLVWDDGDWKWNPPSESLSVTTADTLAGYNKIAQEEPTNG